MLLAADAPADVNWLLSTAVQSGAALVAIVGGLLVSRLVGLVTDRQSLERQLRQAERLQEVALATEGEARRDLERFNYRCFHSYVRDSLFMAHGNLDEAAIDALIEASGWEVSQSDRDHFFDVVIPRVQRAFVIAETNDAVEMSSLATDEALRDDVTEAVEQLEGERAERSSRLGVALSAANLRDPAYAAAERQTRDRRQDELEGAVDHAEIERRASEMRSEHLKGALAGLAQPGGFARTFWSLGYLSVACLVFPLTVMAFAPIALPVLFRAAIVLAFVAGLATFFAEMIRLIRERPSD